MEKEKNLDESLRLVKEKTDNETLKKMIELILEDTPSNSYKKVITKDKLKVLSHYTYEDYSKNEIKK